MQVALHISARDRCTRGFDAACGSSPRLRDVFRAKQNAAACFEPQQSLFQLKRLVLKEEFRWKKNVPNHGLRASPITVCPVCLDNLVDARLLPCLHSVCKTCVDKLLVTATDGNVKCPICQAAVTLPSGGAESLPKDVTVAANLPKWRTSKMCAL